MNETATPIPIMRPGRYKATSGELIGISESSLKAMAADYDPKLFQAPLVAGTPQHDDPAGGWVKALVYADGVLKAVPEHMDPAFEQAIGQHKGIMASIFTPGHPDNPTPGKHYLRHVGFKGVPVPVVKGLKQSFASGSECLTLEFADPAPSAEFVAPAGFTVTKTGIADLAALRGEAARRGCSLLEALESAQIATARRKRAKPGTVAFAAAPGCTVTQEGLDDLARARAYAREHRCGLSEAIADLSA